MLFKLSLIIIGKMTNIGTNCRQKIIKNNPIKKLITLKLLSQKKICTGFTKKLKIRKKINKRRKIRIKTIKKIWNLQIKMIKSL